MARTLFGSETDFYRVVVTYEFGRREYMEEFEPFLNDDGTTKKDTAIHGPYGRKSTASAVARSVVPWDSMNRRLVEKRIQRLTPVVFETTKIDQFGNREVSISAELRWMDV